MKIRVLLSQFAVFTKKKHPGCHEEVIPPGSLGRLHSNSFLEKGEIEEGQTTLWLTPNEALERMKTDQPKKIEGHFILKREIAFLEA
ncbi:MAG: hypothetical protein AB199_03105 [Parcubacteria bacterium C7867-004]|nr:MAG: hypothetical protein AB199_03105 [Parcubacteria bacterium C7867-004]